MTDNKIKLARETIRMLLNEMQQPLTVENYVERLADTKEITEAAEIVYVSLGETKPPPRC